MRVLCLSTYPVVEPRHGGQRRISAFAEFYRSLGWSFTYACVFAPPYGGRLVSPHDFPIDRSRPRWADVPFIDDLKSGPFAAEDPAAYLHFRTLVERVQPDIVQLEGPFMYPLVKRLRAEGLLEKALLLNSSQNWEAPLKAKILQGAGVPAAAVRDIAAEIENLEVEVTLEADLTVAVSAADAAVYRGLAPRGPVTVVPNGVNRPHGKPGRMPEVSLYEGRKFFFFVGSAYPPNIDGFCRLVADGGLFMVPPRKHFAVCGGVSDGIFHNPAYRRFMAANSDRLQFFPDIDDPALYALRSAAHAILLPIEFGGGSNLKTAEALVSGKHVITTSMALRGFAGFEAAEGVVVADTPKAFRRAMIEVLAKPPLKLSADTMKARECLYWDRSFADSDFAPAIRALAGRTRAP